MSVGRTTVLVVDDNASLRDAYAAFLNALGHQAVTAADGAEALALLHGGVRPDLILLDLSMPTMDGKEFRAAQQADPQLDRIPVIVLSAEDLAAGDVVQLGCCGVLRKPSPGETILAALERGRQCAAHRASGATTPLPPARWTGRRGRGRCTASSGHAP